MNHTVSQRTQVFERDDELGRWTVATCLPHPELAPFVSTYWFGAGQINYRRDRILPNAGGFLLINLGPTQYRIESGPPERRVPFKDIWYSGVHQTPIETEAPEGSALLGVALKGVGVRPLLGGDASEYADRIVPLSAILGDVSLQLRERLGSCADVYRRFELLEQWLRSRLDKRMAAHSLVDWTMRSLARESGQVSIESLASQAGVTRKYLTDLFRRDVGIAPKAIARVYRFQSALKLLEGKDKVPWVELAAYCGYYDQSHLTRDFKAFSGFTPGEFIRMARPDATSVVVE